MIVGHTKSTLLIRQPREIVLTARRNFCQCKARVVRVGVKSYMQFTSILNLAMIRRLLLIDRLKINFAILEKKISVKKVFNYRLFKASLYFLLNIKNKR